MANTTLEAVIGRILPSGEDPGARETGAAEYVERTLREPYFQRLRGPVEGGLALLDEIARSEHGAAFSACSEAAQDAILRDVQAGNRDTPQFPTHLFFEILINLALEGFLCSPKLGGNRGQLGWRHMGYDPRSHGNRHPRGAAQECRGGHRS